MRPHRRLVLGGWIVAVIVAMAAAHSAGTRYANNLSLGGTDSQRATHVLQRQFPAQAGDSDQIEFHVRSGTIGEPEVRARVTQVLASVERLPHVTNVVSPYAPRAAADVSADRTTACAVVGLDESATALPTGGVRRADPAVRDRPADPLLPS